MGFGKGAGIALYASLLNVFPQQARFRRALELDQLYST